MQARIVMSLAGTHENRGAGDGDDRFCCVAHFYYLIYFQLI